MDDLQTKYDACVEAMGVIGRVRRIDSMFCWSRDYLARSIAAASPGLSDLELNSKSR